MKCTSTDNQSHNNQKKVLKNTKSNPNTNKLALINEQTQIHDGMVQQGLTSHSTHYRSCWGRFYGSDDQTNSIIALKDNG